MKTSVVSLPHYDEAGYDTFVLDDEHGIYAIYDGMGVSEGSRYASTYCKEQTIARREALALARGPHLARMLDDFAINIGKSSPNGGTTGVVIRIGEEGQIEYAMMGDSRLYVQVGEEVMQIGQDEGVGNLLSNYIGLHTLGCQQFGTVPQWDKFMICSDGITGDWPDQFIAPADMQAAFNLDTPRRICNQLVQLSSKPDDKTIIVGIKE